MLRSLRDQTNSKTHIVGCLSSWVARDVADDDGAAAAFAALPSWLALLPDSLPAAPICSAAIIPA